MYICTLITCISTDAYTTLIGLYMYLYCQLHVCKEISKRNPTKQSKKRKLNILAFCVFSIMHCSYLYYYFAFNTNEHK